LLMSAFHSSPWLKLMSSRRNFTDRIEPPHSNRRSPPMLSGRWQRWLAAERALLPRPIRFQRPASTTVRPLEFCSFLARPRPLAGAGSDGRKGA
jgi:hypothetical protein